MKYLKRILGLPFFIALMVIASVWSIFLKSYLWVRWGGEAVNYNDRMNRKTISDIFYSIQRISQGSDLSES